MKNIFKLFLSLIAGGVSATEVTPSISGFIAKKEHIVIKTLGKYKDRHAPFSTFKVPLALMGFNEGILTNKDLPKWEFKDSYEANFQDWYTREKGIAYNWCQDHTPETFMKHSVLWFSHQITRRLGMQKFQNYVVKLNYGNMDVTGNLDKNDGLTNSWLGTSLEISPLEQLEFIEKLCDSALDLSISAQEKTREIMDRHENWNGWKLYGKTGGGNGQNGWFIGWLEKNGEKIVFAHYLDLDDPTINLTDVTIQPTVGLTAKEVVRKNLKEFLS